MSRHRTFRVIAYKTETLFVDVAARDQVSAVARAKTLWEAGQQQLFHALIEFHPMRFEVDEEVTEELVAVVNEDRARWAKRALQTFSRETGSGMGEEGVTDLICDLGHYAHAAGIKFDEVLERAGRHWLDETLDEVQS